jgi:hypothetical protein
MFLNRLKTLLGVFRYMFMTIDGDNGVRASVGGHSFRNGFGQRALTGDFIDDIETTGALWGALVVRLAPPLVLRVAYRSGAP